MCEECRVREATVALRRKGQPDAGICVVCLIKGSKDYQDFADQDEADERHRNAGS